IERVTKNVRINLHHPGVAGWLHGTRNFRRSGCSDPPRTSAGRRGMKVAQGVSPGKIDKDYERRRRDTYCLVPGDNSIVSPLWGSPSFSWLRRAYDRGCLHAAPTGAGLLRAKAISIAHRPI